MTEPTPEALDSAAALAIAHGLTDEDRDTLAAIEDDEARAYFAERFAEVDRPAIRPTPSQGRNATPPASPSSAFVDFLTDALG